LVRLGEHGEGHGRHGDERDADGLKREGKGLFCVASFRFLGILGDTHLFA
jgi:hypothetical protein